MLLAVTAAVSAQSPAPPKTGAGRAAAPAPQVDANGFRIGDVVEINTGQGWMKGTILSANGNVYRVRSQIGIDTTKLYPDEVRRIGPLTSKDRAAGQYNLHDAVQVNVNGAWVDGEIITTLGLEYQVQLPDRRTVWANAQTMRPGTAAAKPAAPKSGRSAEARSHELRREDRRPLCHHRRLRNLDDRIPGGQGDHARRIGRRRPGARMLDGRRPGVPAQAR
jgi:hypothetical protein